MKPWACSLCQQVTWHYESHMRNRHPVEWERIVEARGRMLGWLDAALRGGE